MNAPMKPVIVVEARKDGGWRVAVRASTDGVYLWQHVAMTLPSVTQALESAATVRTKILAPRRVAP